MTARAAAARTGRGIFFHEVFPGPGRPGFPGFPASSDIPALMVFLRFLAFSDIPALLGFLLFEPGEKGTGIRTRPISVNTPVPIRVMCKPIARQVSVKNVTKYYTSDFYPPKIPRQVFLPPGYGFAIWFKSGELTWQTMFTC